MCFGQCGVEEWHLETSCAADPKGPPAPAGPGAGKEWTGDRPPLRVVAEVLLCLVVFPSAGSERLSASVHNPSPLCLFGASGRRLLTATGWTGSRLQSPGTNRRPLGFSSLIPTPWEERKAPVSADHHKECPLKEHWTWPPAYPRLWLCPRSTW